MGEAVEQWRLVAVNNRYEASSLGRMRFRSTKRLCSIFCPRHYRIVTLYYPEKRGTKSHSLSRLIAEAFLGPAEGRQIDHVDGNKHNNAVSNLEYVSQSENIQRSYDRGQHPYQPAEKHYLSPEEHDRIKALHAAGMFQTDIAKLLTGEGILITNSAVSKIVNGKVRPRRSAVFRPSPPLLSRIKQRRLDGIARTREALRQDPTLGANRLARKLNISSPTATRYLREVRRQRLTDPQNGATHAEPPSPPP